MSDWGQRWEASRKRRREHERMRDYATSVAEKWEEIAARRTAEGKQAHAHEVNAERALAAARWHTEEIRLSGIRSISAMGCK